MNDVAKGYRLTHAGALKAVQAAIEHATEMKKPVTVSVCDASGVLIAAIRMDGAYFMSIESSLNKAATAASIRRPTGEGEDMVALKLAAATFGRQVNGLKGGVPIIVEGQCIGGIGAGSATGEEDRQIAEAGLKAIEGADCRFEDYG